MLEIVEVLDGFLNRLTLKMTCLLDVEEYDSDTVIVVVVIEQLTVIVDGYTMVQVPVVVKYPD